MSELPDDLKPSFPYSVINKLDRLSKQLIPIDAKSATKLAERLTGLKDWGEGDFQKRLDSTIDGLNEAHLNTTGLFGARYALNWHLMNRLRVVELAKQRPELRDIPIERPLVITGFFRTGTTFLHNVLAADPDNRVAKAWELSYPVGRKRDLLGDEAWRRAQAKFTFGFNQSVIPDQDVAHNVTADSYEECFFLLENDMAVLTFYVGFGAWSYAMDMLGWDMTEPYEFHKLQLQILTEQRAQKRWSLKCPWHLWHLDTLLAVYPDARIIHTHRDVAKSLGSHCSLCARMNSKLRGELDLKELGKWWLEYYRIGLDRGMKARESIPASQLYDVRLKDLMAQPVEELHAIYKHFGLPWSDELAELFLARIAEKPTAQEGEHEYNIEDFGLTDEQVRETFADYRKRFRV